MKKLYHGSDKEVRKPIYGFGRKDCDYGSAFYLCDTFDAAEIWASQYHNGGVINEYKLNLEELNILNLGHSSKEDILKWVAILCANRVDINTLKTSREDIELFINHFLPDISKVDLIIGYRADDSYYDYTEAFLNNDFPLELLSLAMKLGKLGLQYALIGKKAFEKIIFVNSTEIPASNKYKLLEEQANKEFEDLYKRRKIDQTYLRDILREIS